MHGDPSIYYGPAMAIISISPVQGFILEETDVFAKFIEHNGSDID